MYDNDPEIMLLILGIIVETSLQEKYVNQSQENIHSEADNLQRPLVIENSRQSRAVNSKKTFTSSK